MQHLVWSSYLAKGTGWSTCHHVIRQTVGSKVYETPWIRTSNLEVRQRWGGCSACTCVPTSHAQVVEEAASALFLQSCCLSVMLHSLQLCLSVELRSQTWQVAVFAAAAAAAARITDSLPEGALAEIACLGRANAAMSLTGSHLEPKVR
eukprot:1159491-Pelagomonas_calceolata.AAC.16